jgi:hypothetical protein
MRSKCLAALRRIVLSKRERVMALDPYERGLIGSALLRCATSGASGAIMARYNTRTPH